MGKDRHMGSRPCRSAAFDFCLYTDYSLNSLNTRPNIWCSSSGTGCLEYRIISLHQTHCPETRYRLRNAECRFLAGYQQRIRTREKTHQLQYARAFSRSEHVNLFWSHGQQLHNHSLQTLPSEAGHCFNIPSGHRARTQGFLAMHLSSVQELQELQQDIQNNLLGVQQPLHNPVDNWH